MFKDRCAAGERLAEKLKEDFLFDPDQTLVLGIPRGGIVVGKQISQKLTLPLDGLITKKIHAPENEAVAIGVVGEGGVVVWEDGLIDKLQIPLTYKQQIVKEKVLELEKKVDDFRGEREIPVIKGKKVILVDDGIATGATMKAAIRVLRNFEPTEIIVTVPIIALDQLTEIKSLADKVIYLEAPEVVFSLSEFYEEFDEPGDEEVRELLRN